MLQAHDSIFSFRGMTVKLSPPTWSYVYLLHFEQPIGDTSNPKATASHYCGSTKNLDARLQLHGNGTGAAIMKAVTTAGIPWHVCRLWRFDDCLVARSFERKLKRAGHNPKKCYLCNPQLRIDDLTFARQGHRRLASPQKKRRPLSIERPVFVVRKVESVR